MYYGDILARDVYYHPRHSVNHMSNYTCPGVPRLLGPLRGDVKVTELIVHESVTTSVDRTIAVLKKRKLGVQFILGPGGAITQHADLVYDRMAHAGWRHNSRSIGIEMVNPYYPEYVPKNSSVWERAIEANWAHKKMYVIPPREQLESLYGLLRDLLSIETPEFDIPQTWIGWNKRRYSMGRAWRGSSPRPGIYAHAAFGHADGCFPVLYCILRAEAGLESEGAYATAIQLATKARWSADTSWI